MDANLLHGAIFVPREQEFNSGDSGIKVEIEDNGPTLLGVTALLNSNPSFGSSIVIYNSTFSNLKYGSVDHAITF